VIPSGAPNISETLPAAQAGAAPTSAPVATATGTPAFDAILMLQNIAATAETLDMAALEAGETSDLIASDDSVEDEDNGDELEASLAFLADLLTVVPKSSAREFESGAQSQGDSSEPSPMPVAAKAGGDSEFDAAQAAAQPVIKADAETLLLTPMLPETLESRAASGDASQGLARAAELLAAARTSAPPAQDKPPLATHVRDPRWADELGARVSLMIRAGESTASLQLTPLDLGPVEVNVTVRDSQATIHFGAAQADTRALLEASLPKLRELLAAQGYQLTDSSVSSGFARSQRQDATPGARAADEAETSITEARSIRSLNLLDVYA
jgi:flagellar hook-length control protein FliK